MVAFLRKLVSKYSVGEIEWRNYSVKEIEWQ